MLKSMDTKKIALFIHSLSMGGIQKIIVRLANEFAKRGHEVDLVLAKGEGALISEVSSDVQIVNLDQQHLWMGLPALLRYLKRGLPDVLFAAEAPINLVAIWTKILSRRPFRLVVSVRSNMTQYAKSDNVWYSGYIPTMIRWFYPRADKIVAVSEGVLDDLSRIFARASQKGCVVYNPVVDQELFQKAEQSVNHPWLDGDMPVILGVGRLTHQKNFGLLLRAFATIRLNREARLIILGDGRERKALKRLAEELGIADEVSFEGFKENPYRYMSRASLFVLSSNSEGFGNVIVEALACGCPVISTDSGGPREILQDGKWGRLVPVNDEEALAEAMSESLSETHDPSQLRKRAVDFSVDEAVDEYLEVLIPG